MISSVPVKRYNAFNNLSFHLPLRLKPFISETLVVIGRKLIIKNAACSDGCSPKYRTRWGVIGIWDGPKRLINKQYYLPVTYQAFFLHDVLLENHVELGLTKKQCHDMFAWELRKTDFLLKELYIAAVYAFGPKD